MVLPSNNYLQYCLFPNSKCFQFSGKDHNVPEQSTEKLKPSGSLYNRDLLASNNNNSCTINNNNVSSNAKSEGTYEIENLIKVGSYTIKFLLKFGIDAVC